MAPETIGMPSASTNRIRKPKVATMPNLTPSDIFDRLESEPEPVRASLRQFRSRACAQQYRLPYTLTQGYLSAPARVLDWGCGNGHFSYFLQTIGHKVDCYAFGDPAPVVVHLQSKPQAPVVFTGGTEFDPVRIPFPDQSIDAVFSVGVLEHVREVGSDEKASLREINRILGAGGLFFCFHLPNRFSWIEALTTVVRSRHHHTYKYTRSQIAALLDHAGFEPLVIRRYNAFPRNIFSSLPWSRKSRLVAHAVDALDSLFTLLLNPLCQNYGIVARKKTAV